MDVITTADRIINEYLSQGFALTLRQLYYQFVSRNFIRNSERSYKNLGSVISKARLAGLIDWQAIEDRSRNVISTPHWNNPAEIIADAAEQFRIDRWQGQGCRPEVWIEKEALAGVLETVCNDLDVSLFPCKGYASASELWRAAQRLIGIRNAGQSPVILYLGDHDPSGLDMTRDLTDRLRELRCDATVKSIALNIDQVRTHRLPPNPVKTTDTRFSTYRDTYGNDCWELDALEPTVLTSLVERHVLELRDNGQWQDVIRKENEMLQELATMAANCKAE